jgi:predicted ATPase
LKALAFGPLGSLDQAEDCINGSLDLLEGSSDAAGVFYIRLHDVLFRILCRDLEGAVSATSRFKEITDALGPGGWAAISLLAAGWCSAEEGNREESISRIREAIEAFEVHHWGVWRPYFDAVLAELLQRSGRGEEAMMMLTRALARIEKTGERLHEAEVNRIRGETLLALPEPDELEGERALRTAVFIARDQEAKLFELRATVSLARFLQRSGRTKEARKPLEKCLEGFAEGLDFRDLQEAMELLEEIV